MKQNPSRTALAAVMTLIVVTLLVLSNNSNGKTTGFALFPGSGGSAAAASDDQIAYDDDAATQLKIPHLDFPELVRATLQAGPADAPQKVEIPVYHPSATGVTLRADELRQTQPMQMQGRELALEFSAIVFALFGLFVLWWGRDRASLWLGIFCSSFAPAVFPVYGALPEWGMLVAGIVADLLGSLSIYAFFEIARTFALEAIPDGDPLRRWIDRVRDAALTVVLCSAVVSFAATICPTVFVEPVPDKVVFLENALDQLAKVGVLCLGPIALLAIGWWRATSAATKSRVRITLLTTLAAESGVLYSTGLAWSRHEPSNFDNYWFTLIAIPIGFLVSIPAYKVVEVKFVLNRILVFTAMTAIIAGVITISEMWADRTMNENVPEYLLSWLGAKIHTDAQRQSVATVLRFCVAFLIVLSFGRCHDALNEFFKALFFRRRDDAVRSLRAFVAERTQFITLRDEMLQQAITVVCDSVGARGAAFYEVAGSGFALATTCGETAWPAIIGENDPAFTLLRGGRRRVDLATLDPTPSTLGTDGIAIRMALGSRVIGSLIVGGRIKQSEGPYEREELEVLEDIARSVSDALFNLRANETADFVRGVADGSIAGIDVMQKAEALCDLGLPGADSSLRRPTKPAASAAIVARRATLARDETNGTLRLPSLDPEKLRAE